ncbi:hypothetical protein DBV05_g2778 [Lasiodiplodia theobromae]|uniref:Uncharacterized protein n=1 Tax=Lasiodiplodia theobromae TaxID=45133 RepID=A0A5N5DNV6_9PEZI|nr:hypothetical protein DBV05_g2778 [Lasiodiplodia theobromae]
MHGILDEEADIAIALPLPQPVLPKSPLIRTSPGRSIAVPTQLHALSRTHNNTSPLDRPYACITAPLGTYERHIYNSFAPMTCLGCNCTASSSSPAPSPPPTSSSLCSVTPKTATHLAHQHPTTPPPSSSDGSNHRIQYQHRPGSSHRAPQPPSAAQPAVLLDPSQFIRPSRLVRILAPTTKPTPATAIPTEKDGNTFKIVAHCPKHSSALEKSQCCFDSHPPAVWSCRGGAAEEGEAAATSTWAPRPSRRCFSIAITLCIIVFVIVVTLAVVWTLVIQKEK